RELLWAQLITALDRSGRQADALAAYRRIRAVLRDELGADPGEQLQRAHQDVLARPRAAAAPLPPEAAGDVLGVPPGGPARRGRQGVGAPSRQPGPVPAGGRCPG